MFTKLNENYMRKNITIMKITFIILLSLLFIPKFLPCYAIVHKPKPSKQELKFDISKQKIINVTDEYYRGILEEIQSNPVKYRGKKIIISGFVFKPDNSQFFILSRIWMYCCAADAEIIGLPVQWKNSSKIKEGAWIKITGNIAVRLKS